MSLARCHICDHNWEAGVGVMNAGEWKLVCPQCRTINLRSMAIRRYREWEILQPHTTTHSTLPSPS